LASRARHPLCRYQFCHRVFGFRHRLPHLQGWPLRRSRGARRRYGHGRRRPTGLSVPGVGHAHPRRLRRAATGTRARAASSRARKSARELKPREAVDLNLPFGPDGQMIRVASYNIQKSIGTDFRRRPERILDVLVELDADVIALQEVDRRFGARVTSLSPDAIAAATGYRPVVFGARPQSLGWHGNTLLVRKDIEVVAQRTLILPGLEPRGAVLADLQL